MHRIARSGFVLAVSLMALAACAVADRVPEPGSGQEQAYQCGDMRIHAEFEDQRVIVHIGMGTLALEAQEVESDARYRNRHGDVFERQGPDEAVLTLAGDEPQACRASDQLPPWREAELRGAGFWAMGQEPGWTAELNTSRDPALLLSLDYGARALTFHQVDPFVTPEGGTAFRAASDEGEVELHIERAPCRDSMSGERFNATVSLKLDGTTYPGCGRFLRP